MDESHAQPFSFSAPQAQPAPSYAAAVDALSAAEADLRAFQARYEDNIARLVWGDLSHLGGRRP